MASLAQTPGMVIKSATGAGARVLDPDGDGYVSQKTNGVQLGFTVPPDNDVTQSEIPYVALVRPDAQGDLQRGPSGGFTEIVGTDEIGNNAILTYSDDKYLYYRFRLSGYASNSKSYSILIDTDEKFGYTGINKDDDALTGNPGFEVEIVLETNFNVNVYNVNGIATRPTSTIESASYDTNCQKSIAVSQAGGDPDYFYDFFIPIPDALRDKPLRYVALTSMNPMPAIGNNGISDLGGVASFTNLDQAFTDLINAQTPTLPGAEVLERTACPTINPVGVSDASITGTTVSGAIVKVYVYQSNGTTLVGSGTATTTGTTWSINKTDLKNASNIVIPLVSGYEVRATAIAVGMGVSYDNCDIETVIIELCNIQPPNSISLLKNSQKDVVVTFPTNVTGTVTLYNSNGTIWQSATITNNNSITLSNGNPLQNGSKIPDDIYSATLKVGSCETNKFYGCLGVSISAGKPTINSPITLGSSTITGTGGVAGATIILYADGSQIATTTSGAGSWSANVSNLMLCQSITAQQIEPGKCISLVSEPVTVNRPAEKPKILTSGCFSSPGIISGISTEIGAVITLYKNGVAWPGGPWTVQSNGSWSITNVTLNNGDIMDAAVTSGTCLTTSVKSDPVTIKTQTNVSDYTITFNPVTEKQTTVSGTISGGTTYPVTLRLYVDEGYISYFDGGVIKYQEVEITSPGSWNISGLTIFDLAVGSKVQATITGTGCESALSSTFAIVQCITPLVPEYSEGSNSYCIGSTGMVALTTSEVGTIYQLVNASGEARGLPVSGTGGGINLYTNILSASLTGLYVKAYKIGNNACAIISSNVINFEIENPSPTVTFISTSLSVEKGKTAVPLHYSSKSSSPSADKYTVDYSLAANNQGFTDVSTQADIAASQITLAVPAAASVGTYSGTITISSTSGDACTTSYGFTITVFQDGTAPGISVQPVNKTICSGQTTILSVTASSSTSLSYQWQSSTTYSGTYTNIAAEVGSGATYASYTTAALAAPAYYRVIVSNTNGSVTSNVATVTVSPAVSGTGTISGTPTVCAGQNGVNYSVSGISNATSYTWTYDGNGAFINGTGSSVFVNFGTTATGGTLSVKGNNTCGSGTTATYPITLNLMPTAIAGTPISICSSSGTVNITAGASAYNHSSVAWTSSGTAGTIANANSLTDAFYTPSAADITDGRVTLTLTATGTAGCANAISTKNLTIAAGPVATFISPPGADICLNESVTYTTESGKTNYVWNLQGDLGKDYAIISGIGLNSNTITIKWLTALSKTVTVTYSDNGCIAIPANYSVEVHPLPPIGNFY